MSKATLAGIHFENDTVEVKYLRDGGDQFLITLKASDFPDLAAFRAWCEAGAEKEAARLGDPLTFAMKVAAAQDAERQAQIAHAARAQAEDAALEAEAKRAASEAEHARLSLEIAKMDAAVAATK